MSQRPLVILCVFALPLLLAGCGDEAADSGTGHQHAPAKTPNGGQLGRIEGTDFWIETTELPDDEMIVMWMHQGKTSEELEPWDSPFMPIANFQHDGAPAQVEGTKEPEFGPSAFKFKHAAFKNHMHGITFTIQIGTEMKSVPMPHHHH